MSKRGHPRPDVADAALARALLGEYGEEIGRQLKSPWNGLSRDALCLILARTETIRDAEEAKYGKNRTALPEEEEDDSILRRQVRKACRIAIRVGRIPDSQGYLYEVLAMNYYGQILDFQRLNRKRKAEEAAAANAA